MKQTHALTLATINPNVVNLQFGFHGPVSFRERELTNQLRSGQKMPFDEIIKCDSGDSHGSGQKPITFLRQIIALLSYPELLDDSRFPDDVKERARVILASCDGSSVGMLRFFNCLIMLIVFFIHNFCFT